MHNRLSSRVLSAPVAGPTADCEQLNCSLFNQAVFRYDGGPFLNPRRPCAATATCESAVFAIGPYQITEPTVLAPMAGVTDLPFRQLCRQHGAGLVVSEMVSSNPELRATRKSSLRRQFAGEPAPRSVQIAGTEPATMAAAAQFNVAEGAEIIDINMGCPAKKVCRKAAGSALLRHPQLVADILTAVVAAVDVPVTLKIRTGWDSDNRNAVEIAKIAEQAGVAALAIHGRTRACRFNGSAEYATIAAVVAATQLPVIANGDITSPQQAAAVLAETGAAAVMIGRAAQGNPWLFSQINHYLTSGELLTAPSDDSVATTALAHLAALHQFYGELGGLRIARKHIGWYLDAHFSGRSGEFRGQFNRLDSATSQTAALTEFFNQLPATTERAA